MSNLETIWQAKDNFRVSVSSDGNQFFATINAGITGETFMTVGYSCPNFAITKEEIEGNLNGLNIIKEVLDEKWLEIEENDLDEMLPSLYELAKEANNIYNKLLCSKWFENSKNSLIDKENING